MELCIICLTIRGLFDMMCLTMREWMRAGGDQHSQPVGPFFDIALASIAWIRLHAERATAERLASAR